jgi:hypothetical protein
MKAKMTPPRTARFFIDSAIAPIQLQNDQETNATRISLGTIVKKRRVPIARDLGDLGFSAVVGPNLGTSLSAEQSPK